MPSLHYHCVSQGKLCHQQSGNLHSLCSEDTGLQVGTTTPLLLDSIALGADKHGPGRHLYPKQGQGWQEQLMEKVVGCKAVQIPASLLVWDACGREVFIYL